MSLKEKIKEDLKNSLKKGEDLVVSVLRMLLAATNNKETEKRTKIWKQKPDSNQECLEKESQLTEEEFIEVISSEVKKRRESVLEFERGKREDLASKERAEIEILQKYLPEQLSEEELRKIIKEAVLKVNAKEVKDMGKVMAELMPKVKGKADGGLVSKIVKEFLS